MLGLEEGGWERGQPGHFVERIWGSKGQLLGEER